MAEERLERNRGRPKAGLSLPNFFRRSFMTLAAEDSFASFCAFPCLKFKDCMETKYWNKLYLMEQTKIRFYSEYKKPRREIGGRPLREMASKLAAGEKIPDYV